MSESKTGEYWDCGFRAGKFSFLRKPHEQARLDEIVAMLARSIEANGPSEVVDIGCGEGLLLTKLDGLAVSRYVGLDISAVALERLPESAIPVSRVCTSLEAWDGGPPAQARRILVASEVLYYSGATVGDVVRIVRACPEIEEIIVSCVAGRADKPNWDAASQELWEGLAGTGWREIERCTLEDERTATSWDIARFAV